MKTAITEAIKTTLVVSNKESIHIAVDKIMKIASSRSMESQWIDVKESKKAVFDERKIRMAFKDFIQDVPNGTAREFFRFLIELSYDEQPPTKQPTPQQCDKQ